MEANRFQPVSVSSYSTASGMWQKRAQSLFGSLPQFLTWKDGFEFVDSACEIHEAAIYSRLSLWSQAVGDNLLGAFTRLPLTSQERLLHAPQFLLSLRSKNVPVPEELEKYYKFIQAENYLCGNSNSAPDGCWTALGDRYFRSDMDSQLNGTDNPLLSGSLSAAPFVRGILIDAWSPYLNQSWMMPADSGHMQIYNAEEVSHIEKLVARALDYIESVSPLLTKTICSAMHVIRVAKASAAPHAVFSMSARRMIGTCALSNLLSPAWRLGDVCDAIIHETIHALIYRLELIRPLYADKTAWMEGRAESPWSGRSLELHSLVHACLVWYGLWNFWAMHPHELPEALDLRRRAEAGFLRMPASSLLTTALYASLQPEVRSAIEEVFDRVRDTAGIKS